MSSKVVDVSECVMCVITQRIFYYNYGCSGNVLCLKAELCNHSKDQPSGHDGFYTMHAW